VRTSVNAAFTWSIPVDGGEIPALFEPASSSASDVVFVCAHGAGGNMRDAGMENLARTVRANGFAVVRYNFLYRERGRGPAPMPHLLRETGAVVQSVRSEIAPRRLIIGGRSMGGRAASMLAADGFPCDGLLLAAYPLHPAGKPEQLRVAHLPQIRVPVLCLNGTRDALCTQPLMEKQIATLGDNWTMHWLSGADHSFHCLKSSGRSEADVLVEIGETSRRWLAGVLQGAAVS
jgi:uncharacterized protein